MFILSLTSQVTKVRNYKKITTKAVINLLVENNVLARELIAVEADVENDCPNNVFLHYSVLWL